MFDVIVRRSGHGRFVAVARIITKHSVARPWIDLVLCDPGSAADAEEAREWFVKHVSDFVAEEKKRA